MSTIEWPDHLLSLDEWEKMPDDGRFAVEIVEGVLALSPRPVWLHQRAIKNIIRTLDDQLPARLEAASEYEVVLEEAPLTIRVPDVVVASTTEVGDANLPRAAAAQIHLAVEVLSDGTRRLDRVMKFAEYAAAGIPQYWLVDLTDPVTVTTFALVGGAYEHTGEFSTKTTLTVAGVQVRLDPATLIER